MKKIHYLWSILLTICCSYNGFAQSESFDPSSTQDTTTRVARSGIRPSGAESELRFLKPEGYPAKDMDTTYTGFRIEIVVADTLLPDSSDLFFRHGNIFVEKLKDKRFAYTIGDFKDEETATGFFNQFVLPTYTKARIVRYERGKRPEDKE